MRCSGGTACTWRIACSQLLRPIPPFASELRLASQILPASSGGAVSRTRPRRTSGNSISPGSGPMPTQARWRRIRREPSSRPDTAPAGCRRKTSGESIRRQPRAQGALYAMQVGCTPLTSRPPDPIKPISCSTGMTTTYWVRTGQRNGLEGLAKKDTNVGPPQYRNIGFPSITHTLGR